MPHLAAAVCELPSFEHLAASSNATGDLCCLRRDVSA